MAEVNSDIYLKEQTPDILGGMVKGMQMSALAGQNKIQQQQISDDQSARSAFKNNVVQNPDGTTSINRQGVLSDLAKSAPNKYMEVQGQFATQDLNQQKLIHERQMQQADTVSRIAGSVEAQGFSQASYDQAKTMAQQMGQDTTQWPQQVDKNWVLAHKYAGMSASEQASQASKAIDQKIGMIKAQAAAAEAGIPYGSITSPTALSGGTSPAKATSPASAGGAGFSPPPKMRQKAMQDYTNLVNGSRQQADASQSLKDIQAAQKLNEIVSVAPGGDLNKLNQSQTKLAILETAKMAGGGVPTEHELESMTPDNLAQKYGTSIQKLTNKSQPANAGEFIQQAIDYAHGIQTVGAKKLADRANEIADRQRPFLGEKGYQTVKGQITDEMTKNMPPDGRTREYGGKTYKVIGNHWVAQ